MNRITIFIQSVFILTFFSCKLHAQNDVINIELGKVKTKSAKEIKTSRWSIGGETLDRDYADYSAYKSYLGALGTKRIRLQGGWAKCEPVKGEYHFEWLDTIVDDAISQGVSPWIQTSYGNPIYDGGGQKILAGGIPTSAEALKAWDKWVAALVNRYKDRVNEWEIWNEPDISKEMTAAEFAVFFVRTVKIVKTIQPDSRIIAIGLAGLDRTEYVKNILDILKKENLLHFFDVLSFHGYSSRPEQYYEQTDKLRTLVKSYRDNIEMWQGESGAPTTIKGLSTGALTQEDWSETTQAKWVLRKMMGDMGHDIDVTNIFTISDIYYASGDHLKGLNSKGLLKAREDMSIERPKLSYYAYQNAVSIFSEEIERIKNAVVIGQPQNLSVYAFAKQRASGSAVVYWFSDAKPVNEFPETTVSFAIENIKIENPVLVDLLTGVVYKISEKKLKKQNNKLFFSDLPAMDSPMVIVDNNWLEIIPMDLNSANK